MGCILAKDKKVSGGPGATRQRRLSWPARSLNKSMRMAAIRQREAAAVDAAAAPSSTTPQASSSRRSSLANMSRAYVVRPEQPAYDFCGQRRDYQSDHDDYLSQLDCMREQKRNEFEDYGTSPHLTLGAYDRLEFDLNPMENRQDALF